MVIFKNRNEIGINEDCDGVCTKCRSIGMAIFEGETVSSMFQLILSHVKRVNNSKGVKSQSRNIVIFSVRHSSLDWRLLTNIASNMNTRYTNVKLPQ